jgi:ubiquitin-protein ligase
MVCRFASTRVDLSSGSSEPFSLRCIHLTVTPTHGVYCGATLTFAIAVPSEYPHAPPRVSCIDVVRSAEWARESGAFERAREPGAAARRTFHPNISQSDGRVALPLLDRDWRPVLSLNSVVLALQYIFVDPVLEAAYILNGEAASLWCANEPARVQSRAHELLGASSDAAPQSSDLDTDVDIEEPLETESSMGHVSSMASLNINVRKRRRDTFDGDEEASWDAAPPPGAAPSGIPATRRRRFGRGDAPPERAWSGGASVGAMPLSHAWAGGLRSTSWGAAVQLGSGAGPPPPPQQRPRSPTSVHQGAAAAAAAVVVQSAAEGSRSGGSALFGASAWGGGAAASYATRSGGGAALFEQRGRKHGHSGAVSTVDAKRLRLHAPHA